MAKFCVLMCGAALLACAACGSTAGSGVDGGGGGGGGDGGGGGGGAWTAMPLPDDMTDASHPVFRGGNDLVTGIHFATMNQGWIVTRGDNQSGGEGGAVFSADQHSVKDIAFSGYDTAISILGNVEFTGIEPTPSGYVAMTYASDVVHSDDGGATFAIEKNGDSPAGGSDLIGFRETAGKTILVGVEGVISTASSAPGPSASYTDIWAPNAIPPVPNPVPADECQGGPRGTGTPHTRESVYISEDGGFIAYTSNPGGAPELCISHDGGQSFTPTELTVPSGDEDVPSRGVYFTTATNGILWWGDQFGAGPYIQRTTDGGATWSDVALPSNLTSTSVELHGGFFAPDGMHGWITGYDAEARVPLLLATTDAGATWSTVDEGLAAAVDAAGGDKLYCGFALDATHYWVGGARGVVLAHD
jgi:hypothetical protein